MVTQDLCAVCAVDVSEVDDALAYLACSADVLTLDPMTLDEVVQSVLTVGATTGAQRTAERIVDDLGHRLDRVRAAVAGRQRRSVLVLEWTEPAFTAGHWVPTWSRRRVAAVCSAGQAPSPRAWSGNGSRSPAPRSSSSPRAVTGSTVPPTSAAKCSHEACCQRDAEVWAIDADAVVVRPGPRVVDGVEAMASILHPGVAGAPDATLVRRLR